MLHPPERRLRLLLAGHAILSAVLACGYIVERRHRRARRFMPNSFAKDMLFVALSVLGAADVRRRGWTALLIALAYVALVAGQIATLIWGGAPDATCSAIDVSATVALLALDGGRRRAGRLVLRLVGRGRARPRRAALPAPRSRFAGARGARRGA